MHAFLVRGWKKLACILDGFANFESGIITEKKLSCDDV